MNIQSEMNASGGEEQKLAYKQEWKKWRRRRRRRRRQLEVKTQSVVCLSGEKEKRVKVIESSRRRQLSRTGARE